MNMMSHKTDLTENTNSKVYYMAIPRYSVHVFIAIIKKILPTLLSPFVSLMIMSIFPVLSIFYELFNEYDINSRVSLTITTTRQLLYSLFRVSGRFPYLKSFV